MPECPICRRSYDARFQVFVPPHREAFDSVACARRGAEVWGWDKATPTAVVLAPVAAAAVPAPAPTFIGARHKKKVAALAALAIAPGQAALATGVGLLAAGSAASIYLWAKPADKATPVAVSVHHPRPTLSPRPTATLPSTPRPSTPSPVKHPTEQPKVAVTRRAHRASTPARRVHVPPRSSSPLPELISRPVAVPTPKPESKPAIAKTPATTPKAPAPPPAKAPPPTKTPKPEPPTGGAGGITSAAAPAPQRPTSSSKSKKSKPTNPPPAAPPPTTPPPTTTTAEDCMPGNGWGDKNHVHCGPPGQDDQGENSDDQGDETNAGDSSNNGHGHDGDHGNGGGNGHGHGH